MVEHEPIRHDKAAEKAAAILQELWRDFPARDGKKSPKSNVQRRLPGA
jgi:hypothetical protein